MSLAGNMLLYIQKTILSPNSRPRRTGDSFGVEKMRAIKTYTIIVITVASMFLSGCFLAGLGVGAVGGGAAMHAYDTKPAPTPAPRPEE